MCTFAKWQPTPQTSVHRGRPEAVGRRLRRRFSPGTDKSTRSLDVRPEHRRADPEITMGARRASLCASVRADLEICIIFFRNGRPLWIATAIGITCLGHTCPITQHLPLQGTIVVGRPVGPLPREQKQVLYGVRRPECLQPRIVLQQMIEQVAIDWFFLRLRKRSSDVAALTSELRVRRDLTQPSSRPRIPPLSV